MSFIDSAKRGVLQAAKDLESMSGRIGVARSVDATVATRWLKEIAQQLRAAVALNGEPGGAERDAPTLPDGLHRASILLKSWEIGGGKNHETMAEAFSEICAAHDALLANLRTKEVYSGVVRERYRQLLNEVFPTIYRAADGEVLHFPEPEPRKGS